MPFVPRNRLFIWCLSIAFATGSVLVRTPQRKRRRRRLRRSQASTSAEKSAEMALLPSSLRNTRCRMAWL